MARKRNYDELVHRLQQLAEEYYDKGGDMYAECYDREDWIEFIQSCERNGLDPVKELLSCMESRHSEWVLANTL